MLAPPELKAIHPTGTSPVITDGDVVLAESGAIVGKYGGGKFVPSETGYIDNLYYTHYSEGTLAPLLVSRVIYGVIPDRSPLLIRPIVRAVFNALLTQMVDPRLKTQGQMIESHLAKRPGKFFAGDGEPTSADFMMAFSLETIAARAPDVLGEHMKAYVERVRERPGWIKGLEKGGSLDLA
ncbi:glutathione S-transferase [Ceratobasidium sp. AG-Ba]|nr:glutathione S-transferase [Ceratobasidium sp. AG-Ba]